MVKVSDLKRGDFFTLSDKDVVNSSSVWIRGDYCRSLKKYSCINFDDSNKERFLLGSKLVRIVFEF